MPTSPPFIIQNMDVRVPKGYKTKHPIYTFETKIAHKNQTNLMMYES